MRRSLLILPVLLLAPLHVASAAVSGNGQRVTVTRPVTGFKSIEVRAPIDVVVKAGKAFAVSLTTDSNVEPLIKTDVRGDTLVIGASEHDWHLNGKHVVVVTMPELRGLHLAGSGDADVSGFSQAGDVEIRIAGSGDVSYVGKSDGLALSIQGSGNVTLAGGSANKLQIEVDGSGDIKAASFSAKSVSVRMSGSGNAELRVAGGPAAFAVNGSGDIRWSGEASTVSAVTHGSGTIQKR